MAKSGVDLIAIERARQMATKAAGGEDWDAEHDRGAGHELAKAGAVYALPSPRTASIVIGGFSVRVDLQNVLWPWRSVWWKPTPDDRVRELVKAGALIAAAIDAIQAEEVGP